MLQIIDTAYGGFGVGKDRNGKTIFVPDTVTGDVVDAEIIKEHGSYSSARLVSILSPSKERILPNCPYAGVCGGCSFRHIKYTYEQEIKKKILKNALRKVTSIEPLMFTADENYYRIRATVQLRDAVGFYKRSSRDFIPVGNCLNIAPELFEGFKAFKGSGTVAAILAPNGKILAKTDGKINAVKTDAFNGIMHSGGNIEGDSKILYETVFGFVPVGFGGFFQSNRYLLPKLQTYVIEMAKESENILELYAGSGFFTIGLHDKNVTAVEIDKAAVALAKNQGIKISHKDCLDFLKSAKKSYDTIIIDPPREGIDKNIVKEILRLLPHIIIYVSCNPMSLARDIGRLSECYETEKLAVFDMFARTHHIETAALLCIK